MSQKRAVSKDFAWAWAFPLFYGAHIVEEGWAGIGFPHWVAEHSGRLMSQTTFLTLNTIGLLAMIVAVWAGRRWRRARWLLVSVATVTFANGVLHLLASLLTGSYSPGLLTGLLLWTPLGAFALARMRSSESAYRLGVATGLAVSGLVVLLALAGSTSIRKRAQNPAESMNSVKALVVLSSMG